MASLLPYGGTLTAAQAAHLLRRCTYLLTKARIDTFTGMSAAAAVDELFNIPAIQMSEPIDRDTLLPWINTGVDPGNNGDFRRKHYIAGWWMHEALQDPSISHKMEFFLHSNFVISSSTGPSRQYFDYLRLLRYYAVGNFKELANKITVDNMMLRYLDGTSNSDNNPNENYAREFFELFTIGKGPQIGPGNYTYYQEADILAASKLLSGFQQTSRPLGGDPDYWDSTIEIQFGRANYNRHDTTDKTFSSAFSGQTITGATDVADMYRELDDFVEMVFGEMATAKNICRKLYRYFVSNKISTEIETDIITPLAQTLFDNNYNLTPCLKQLLRSQHFYDQDDAVAGDEILGAILKSPLENLLQTINFFGIEIPDAQSHTEDHYWNWYKRSVIDVILNQAGMTFHRPDSVAGYPAYYQEPNFSENWFNGSTLIARYKLAEMLLEGQRVLAGGTNGGVQIDIVDFVANSGMITDPTSGVEIVTKFTDYLLALPPATDRLNYFLNDVFLDDLSLINWRFEWLGYESTGDDSAVKIPLERLFTAILSSQEYQLM